MASVTSALRQVKEDLPGYLEASFIERLCEEVGYRWRDRLLGPVVTIWMFIEQVMAGNVACTAVRHLYGSDISASAYCQARSRLPVQLLAKLMRAVCDWGREQPVTGLWLGRHRTLRTDGSGISMPDTSELAQRFGYPSNQNPGCGFPVAKLLMLFDAATGFILDLVLLEAAGHDMSGVSAVLEHLQWGDVLVGDRGFCSYAHLALLRRRGAHGVFRIHGKKVVDFTPGRPAGRRGLRSKWIQSWGPDDQLVRWHKPKLKPSWIGQADYDRLTQWLYVRELRYTIQRPGFRTRQVLLVTTLLESEIYPAAELAHLYGRRWQIETDLRHLKITMGMDVLKCKSVDGVTKELYAFVIAYNLVRSIMGVAAEVQQVDHDRISFIDALRWLRKALPTDELPELIVNPQRPGRVEPRVKKRRAKTHPYMKKPRHELRQALMEKKDEA